jgi:leader peptidase (prepilin peptidase) / N-methyltransferase
MPVLEILVGFCGLIGLAVGSFLNVVIYRVPRHEAVVWPRSVCPSCHTTITSQDNVPVVSWVLLRARCRRCQSPISARHPLVELASAGLFAGAAARFGFDWALPAFLVLLSGLLALACIDLERLVLPKKIVYPVLGLVAMLLLLAALITGDWHDLLVAGLSGSAWFLVFLAMYASNPRLLGFGDVRLAPVLGLALGWLGVRYVLCGFFLANAIGVVVGLGLVGAGRISRRQPIPYGTFLAVGTAIAIFAGPELLRPFREL